MTASRVFLMLYGTSMIAFSLYCLFYPMALHELASIGLDNSTAITEIRAMYGGLGSALGLYVLISAFQPLMIRPALVLMVLCFAGLAGARSIGISLDNDTSAYSINGTIFEACTGFIALLLLRFDRLKAEAG